MKLHDILKNDTDSLGDDHLGSSINNPIRKDAFKISNLDKIKLIQEKMHDILEIIGMDMNDDSLKGTPKRVAKMFVNEIFGGLNPDNKPVASTFDNKFKYG